MNVRPARIDLPVTAAKTVNTGQVAVPAWIVPVSNTMAMAAFDLPEARRLMRKSAPIDGTLDGVCLPRPVVSTSLPLRSGKTRHVVLLRHPAAKVALERLDLSIGGEIAAFLDPTWLQSPIRDPIDLVAGTTGEGGSRLLRLILSTIPSLFGRGIEYDFCQTARALVSLLHLPQGQLVSRSAIGSLGEVRSYRLPVPFSQLSAPLIALSRDRIVRVDSRETMLEDGQFLHILRTERARTPQDFILLGEVPLMLTCPIDQPDRQAFLPWLTRRSTETQKWGEEAIRRHSTTDKVVVAMLREWSMRKERAPAATTHLVGATCDGVLVWLDVDDPNRLVVALRIEVGSEYADVELPGAGKVRTHVRFRASPALGTQWRLRLIFGSGQIGTVQEGHLEPFSGLLPEGVPSGATLEAAHSLMTAWEKRILMPLRPRLERFGPRGAMPRLSVVVPFAPDPDIVRARASLMACEVEHADLEVVYTTAGTISESVRQLLNETAETYGIAHRLMNLPANTTASDRLVAGLGTVRAPAALVTGHDVLPYGPGWAGRWITSLSQTNGPALIGATLLAVDGSVEHAGGHFFWTGLSEPAVPSLRSVGLPECELPSEPDLRTTEALSANAVGLTAAARRFMIAQGANSPDLSTMFQIAAHQLGACTDMLGRFVRFAENLQPAPVIEASGGWQMSALLVATDGAKPK